MIAAGIESVEEVVAFSAIGGFRRNFENGAADELRVLLQKGIMLRLRALVSRFPEFEAE